MGIFTRRYIYRILLTLVSVLFFIGGEVRGQITLATWNFPNNPDNAIAEGGIAVNLAQTITTNATNLAFNVGGATTNAATADGWDGGNGTKYWQIGCNTQGYSNIIFSSKQKSSNTGPRNFKVQYSIDGSVTWFDVPSSNLILANDAFISGVLTNLSLPSVCSNQVDLQLRWIMTSNTPVSTGTIVANTGTSRIDDIIVQGTLCNIIVSSFLPSTGPIGTKVTISGFNFIGTTSVLFSGVSAAFTVVNDNTITAIVPAILSSGPISVVGATCTSASTTQFQIVNLCAGNGSNLIISELCDPQYNYQTSRYIEIYNPTSNSIDLTGWRVVSIANGAECFTWNLTGSISPGQAMTCGNNNPANGGPHNFGDSLWITGTSGCCFNWNGLQTDGAALYNGLTLIDYVYNTVDWFGNSCLIRNPNVCNPSLATVLSEWTGTAASYAGTSPSTPRSHASNCTGTPPTVNPISVPTAACVGELINLQAVASGGTAPYSYQWKFHNGAGDWQNVVEGGGYAGATAATLTITVAISMNGYQYYCEVSNSGGSCFKASNAVQLTVNSLPVVSANNNGPLCQGSTINLTGSASGGTAAYTYNWAGPYSFPNLQNPTVSNASPAYNGTYTLTVTDANTCTASASTNVSITALPATPTLTVATPCAGTQPLFTAGNGSTYEFYLNNALVDTALTSNTYMPSSPLEEGDQVCVRSIEPFTFDGTLDGLIWGTPLATSAGGPNPSGFEPNRMDAIYLQSTPSYIFGGIAGNLVNGSGHKILLFIDCQPSVGFNSLSSWTNRSNAPYYSMEDLNSGITFDPGFEPEYILGINQANGDAYFDLYNMVTNSPNNYLGAANTSGLLGFADNTGFGDYTKGFEFAIPRSALGNPSGTIKVFAMLVNDPGQYITTYLSNQFLTRANSGDDNYQDAAVQFQNAAPNPISIPLSSVSCYEQTCVTANPRPSAVISGNTTICNGGSADLSIAFSGTAPFTYSINGGTEVVTSSNPISVAVIPTITTSYTVTALTDANCSALAGDLTGLTTITVNPKSSVTSVSGTSPLCNGNSTTFIATSVLGTGIGTWSSSDEGVAVVDGDGLVSAVSAGSCNIVYKITGGCGGTDSAFQALLVNPKPEIPTATLPALICSNSLFTFTATSIPNTSFIWSRAFVAGITNPVSPNNNTPTISETLINETTGPVNVTYTYNLSTASGCTNTQSFTTSVVLKPTVTASALPTKVCPGMPFDLYSTSSLSTIQPATLLPTEDFNSLDEGDTTGPGVAPNNWTTTSEKYTTYPAKESDVNSTTRWTIRKSGHITNTGTGLAPWVEVKISSSKITPIDTTDMFYLADNTVGNGNKIACLISPPIDGRNYTSIILDFWHYYRDKNTDFDVSNPLNLKYDYAYIDVSTDNGLTWNPSGNPAKKYDLTQGYPDDFWHETINLGYLPYQYIKVRFRFEPTSDFYWAIDNVRIKGTSAIQGFKWEASPTFTGFPDTLNVSPGGVIQPTSPDSTRYIATYTDKSTYNTCSSASTPVYVVNLPKPSRPTLTTNKATICSGDNVTLTSSPGTKYQWLHFGALISDTINPLLTTLSTGTSVLNTFFQVRIINSYGCKSRNSDSVYIRVNPIPVAAGTITGTSIVCQGATGVIYTVPVITNATGYAWTLPAGATILAGVNTRTITVSFSAAAISGNITVHGTNTCGNGTESPDFNLTVNPLPTPFITGATSLCSNTTGSIYSTSNVVGHTYVWAVVGGTITAGAGTNSIIITWNVAGAGTVNVTETITATGCSAAAVQQSVTVNPLPTTSAIYHQ